MAARFGLATALALWFASPALAVVVVNENFDSYADQAAFEAVWPMGTGISFPQPYGVLIPGASIPLTPPNDSPPDIQGKAVNYFQGLNVYNGPNLAQMQTLIPSENKSVKLSVDIFDDAVGNKRASVGLRSVVGATTVNLIELGNWNANIFDPFDPINTPPAAVTPVPGTSANYAYRLALFGTWGDGLVRNPDWQYHQLPQELDRTTDTDEIVSAGDVGAGWHRHMVTITPTTVTLEIDLFRDGLRNTSITPDEITGIRPGTPGLDASITYTLGAGTTAPFNSLRFGSPSGTTSNTKESVVDNILLELIDVVAPPTDNADFNGDNIVDGADFLIWQAGFGTGNNLATGDANGDLAVTDADLTIWKNQFGTDPTPAVGAVGAIPEPTTLALAGLAMVAAGLAARRR